MQKVRRNSIILAIIIILFLAGVILAARLKIESQEDIIESTVIETHSSESPKMKRRISEIGITAGESSLTSSFKLIRLSRLNQSSEISKNIEDYSFDQVGYCSARLNIRTEPTLTSEVRDQYYYNEEIHYADFNDKWAVVNHDGELSYVFKSYISDTPSSYVSKTVQNDKRKSFEDYTRISPSSVQGRMQKCAITSPSGLRKVHNRYCVAVGSYFSHNVGQYIDVVLSNGTVIPCIIGDAKADCHTSEDNSLGGDGSCVEFIVDTPSLPQHVQTSGDCSGCKSDWNSKVVEIRLYDYIAYL